MNHEDEVDHQEHAAVDAVIAEEREAEREDEAIAAGIKRVRSGTLALLATTASYMSKYGEGSMDGTIRELIALLQALLPLNAAADAQAQVDMANEANARADRLEADADHDVEAVRTALHTGQRSIAKTRAQEAFVRLTHRLRPRVPLPLMTPGQAAHAASFGAPLGGAMPSDCWEINLKEASRDAWERIARRAIQQFNLGSICVTPGKAVFDAWGRGGWGTAWADLPSSHREHYERIAQAAIRCVGGVP
jgi:hypothetical protein